MAKKKSSSKSTVAASLPKQERKWRAECDARTIAEADAIKRDPGRMSAAKKAAKGLVAEADARAKNEVATAQSLKSLAKKS